MKRLIDREQIRLRVSELGSQIAMDYRDRPVTLIGVLTGSIVLLADLIRQIDLPLRVGVIQASSYRGATTRPGPLVLNSVLLPDIKDRDVLLVDDIFDTGRTLAELIDLVTRHQPRSLKSLVLLKKRGRSEVTIEPDYFGFEIPDKFVVGYGLDYDEAYRHLPDIRALDDVNEPYLSC